MRADRELRREEGSGDLRRTRLCWRPSERAGPVETYEGAADGGMVGACGELEAQLSGRFSGAKTAF